MNNVIQKAIRLLVVMALLLTSAVAFSQDETETTNTATPFVGIRFMEADNGVLVTGIITNTPAKNVGLQAGDVITAIENDTVDASNVQDTVWSYDSNATITLTIDRNGRELTQNITLMARPDDLFSNPLYVLPMEPASIGLVVTEFDGNLMVLGVVEGSQAEEAGFGANDIITRVDGDDVESVGDAAIAMSDLDDGNTVEFYVTRGNENLVIEIIIDRRRPRPRPRPRDIISIYNTDAITLGYGEGFIEVQAVTPAHDLYIAGLRDGDAIVAINGDSINALNDLFADDSIELTVERGDSIMYLNVPTSVAPLLMFGVDAPQTQDAGEWLGLHEKQVTLGVRYIQLEPNSPYFKNDVVDNGAYVAEVIAGLPAEQAGIQVGDILISVDGEPITLDIDLRNRIYAHQAGDTVTFEVLRQGAYIKINVTLRVATS
jgi:S1-C subfamily serine protease